MTTQGPTESPQEEPDLSTLEACEAVIERGQVAMAAALLRIYERRWYRTNYSSFTQYLKQRWHLSRARGYQLLHFARVRRASTMVDGGMPLNERQARLRDGNGKLRQAGAQDLILRGMGYLSRLFEHVPGDQRREFITCMRDLLADMERYLNREGDGNSSGDSK